MFVQIDARTASHACRVAAEVADVLRDFQVLVGERRRPLQLEIFDLSSDRDGMTLLVGLAEPPERRTIVFVAISKQLEQRAPRGLDFLAGRIGSEGSLTIGANSLKIVMTERGRRELVTVEVIASEHAPEEPS